MFYNVNSTNIIKDFSSLTKFTKDFEDMLKSINDEKKKKSKESSISMSNYGFRAADLDTEEHQDRYKSYFPFPSLYVDRLRFNQYHGGYSL